MSTAEEIIEAASKLSAEQQVAIANHLYELARPSDPKIEKAWMEEVERRIEEVEQGKVELLDGDEVMRELRARFKHR